MYIHFIYLSSAIQTSDKIVTPTNVSLILLMFNNSDCLTELGSHGQGKMQRMKICFIFRGFHKCWGRQCWRTRHRRLVASVGHSEVRKFFTHWQYNLLPFWGIILIPLGCCEMFADWGRQMASFQQKKKEKEWC